MPTQHTVLLVGGTGRTGRRALVTRATTRLCRGIEALQPEAPVMSSVSVHRPEGLDRRRGPFERAFLWMLRGLLPPAKDNQRAANFLLEKIGPHNAFVQWAVVRPDSLLEGQVSGYTVHEGLVNNLFAPGNTNMANVAHLMCELVTNPKTWADWKSRLPVIINAAASIASAPRRPCRLPRTRSPARGHRPRGGGAWPTLRPFIGCASCRRT